MWWRPVSEVVVVAAVPEVVAAVPDVVAPGAFFGFFAVVGCWLVAEWWRWFLIVAWWRRFLRWWRRSEGCWLVSVAVRSGTAGIGIGNGNRAPGTTHQQARCEHANTCSEAQMRQTHDLSPQPQDARQQSNVCKIVA